MRNPSRAPRQLTGRMVLLCLVAFFGIVIGVNMLMMKFAIDTLSGTEVDSAYRASLAYERVLASVGDHGRLVGSAGLTFVWLNAALTQHPKTKAEDFYLQELPVPIVGLRYEALLIERLGLRASVAGGLLPKVDSLRTEGGTVYTWQSHADASLAVTYAFTNMLSVEAGYQFTYLHQHEKSHEDDNVLSSSTRALGHA